MRHGGAEGAGVEYWGRLTAGVPLALSIDVELSAREEDDDGWTRHSYSITMTPKRESTGALVRS